MNKIKNENNIYYDYNNILSRHCMLNFILTNRGGGKTYNFKKKAINNFLKKGKQFVYIRRCKTHLEDVPETFFDSEICSLFEGHEFKATKKKAYIDGKVAGFFIPLSIATSKKSNSYPDVTLICFDEFIPEGKNDQYVSSNEPELFMSLVETIVRTRDDVTVICCANKVNIANLYFEYFKIYPEFENGIKMYKNNTIAVELNVNENFVEEKKKTRWGQIMCETHYGSYAIENKSLVDDESFILNKKPSNAKFMFSLYDGVSEYGIWNCGSMFYIDNKVIKNSKLRFAFSKNYLRPPFKLFYSFQNSALFWSFKKAISNGNVFYKNKYVKNGIMCITKYIGIR